MVSAVVLVLSATSLLRRATRVIPVPVIKGIQFGAGLSLVISAGSSLLGPLPWAGNGDDTAAALDNRLWALAAFLALLATQRLPRFPYALLVFGVGLLFAVLSIVVLSRDHIPGPGIWKPRFELPAWTADAIGMGVAQLPLTTLNSVIAASALAADLFPPPPPSSSFSGEEGWEEGASEPVSGVPTTPSVTALGLSVAAMNLAGCWFGAMPVCHGAGGLAAQWRFGARSGASVVLLGALKVAAGALLGDALLLPLLRAFPRALLGVMVLAAGLELARVGQSLNHGASDLWESAVQADHASAGAGAGDNGDSDAGVRGSSGGGVGGGSDHGEGAKRRHRAVSDEERAERWTVMLMTAAGILAFKNDAVGFVAGLLCHAAYAVSHAMERRRERRRRGESAPLLRD